MVDLIAGLFALLVTAFIVLIFGPWEGRRQSRKELAALKAVFPDEQVDLRTTPHAWLRIMDAHVLHIVRGERSIEVYFTSGSAGVPSMTIFRDPLVPAHSFLVNCGKVPRLVEVVKKYKHELKTNDPQIDKQTVISTDFNAPNQQQLLTNKLVAYLRELLLIERFYELRLIPADKKRREPSRFIQARPGMLIATRHRLRKLQDDPEGLKQALNAAFRLREVLV